MLWCNIDQLPDLLDVADIAKYLKNPGYSSKEGAEFKKHYGHLVILISLNDCTTHKLK